MRKQVSKEHYSFSSYMTKKRWCSVWHQLDEVLSLHPTSVLEVGPGLGVFKAVASTFGLEVKTLDIAEDLKPDVFGLATKIPFLSNSFDVVCSFQMLEHIEFEDSLYSVKEMGRVSKRNIVLSLPDAETQWLYSFHIPKFGVKRFSVRKPFMKLKKHCFDGEHYWEVNKVGYELDNVLKEIGNAIPEFKMMKTYRVPENPYHRFLVFEKL